MKKLIKTVLITLVVIVLSFLGYEIYAKIVQKQKIAQQIKRMPEFYFYKPGTNNVFTEADLKPNKATLIINFHPECEHCTYEAEIISKQASDFEQYQLLFISYADTQQIKTFANKHQLTGYRNITFLEDKDMVFDDISGKSGVPTSFIYDKNGKLVKQFLGEVKVEALLKYLKG